MVARERLDSWSAEYCHLTRKNGETLEEVLGNMLQILRW